MRYYLLFLLLLCAASLNAQEHRSSRNDFDEFEIGLAFGPTGYEFGDIFGPTYTYKSLSLNANFNWRPGRHFQIGASVAPAVSGDGITAISFNMSFPVGNDRFYFYPGWHLTYLAGNDGNSNGGPGIHVGGFFKISDMFAINTEIGGNILLFGGGYYFQTGLRLLLPGSGAKPHGHPKTNYHP